MNYLSHFVLNHGVCGLPQAPCFVLGVALPDLWSRFSRRVRIPWRGVRAATPTDAEDADLRDGLLNHVDADGRFHDSPLFNGWMRSVRRSSATADVHPAVADFIAHVSIELALDARLIVDDGELPERFYRLLEASDVNVVERRVRAVAGLDAVGLGDVLRMFCERRFLHAYPCAEARVEALRRTLALIREPTPADVECMRRADAAACELADPQLVWAALAPQGASSTVLFTD